MQVLIAGSGGREHALAWKLSQSPKVSRIFVAPGNGGTAGIAENVSIAAEDVPALVAFAREKGVDLAVIGPEAPLVAGVVDAFAHAGLRAFGPTAQAARLEASKAFAKQFMFEEGIPTAPAAIFTDPQAAQSYLCTQHAPIVVKASGLAAGKGVIVCQTRDEAQHAVRQMMIERLFGPAGDQVVIETCLEGEEVSLLAFSDGQTVVPMVPARDYKRVADGDQGPNTGGMGGYAPSATLSPAQVDEIVARVLRPAVDGMRRRGTPYVGVLYAGLMMTSHGLQVLEFNCRFGDPETQVLLPLLESDLMDVILACVEGRLEPAMVRWRPESTACVVLASAGYPGAYQKGREIAGIEEAGRQPGVVVFQAGTRPEGGRLLTEGGRVLAVTATARDLDQALERVYAAVQGIEFEGMHYRRDIGRAARRLQRAGDAYRAAGVNIDAGNRAVDLMRAAVQRTYTPAVLAGVGAFGGLYRLAHVAQAHDPVLVASTDGVGTKTMIAAAVGRYDTIGHDIVNHCVNDILVQGARPLFFLDYIASGQIDPEQVAALVTGCAEACRAVGCALLGGETAEMPGVYQPGTFDLVGTMVGWVEREGIVDGRDVQPGDVCLGLPSSGLHTNGFSLARRVFAGLAWDTVLPELGAPLAQVLLTPHRAYLREVEALWGSGVTIKAMAHITGGGLVENVPRALPPSVAVEFDPAAWPVPAVFRAIQARGSVDESEMFRVFNMGIGLVLIVPAGQASTALGVLGGEGIAIGRAIAWDGQGARVRFCG